MDALISVRGLQKNYGKTSVLGGIDFDVHAGEILGFLGPNGAGKTTTLEILVGLRDADGGEVRLFGERSRYPLRGDVKARIGMSFQASGLYEDLTVRETLTLFGNMYDAHTDVEELAASVALTDQLKKRVRHLSGGQKQRLVFAISIVNDPDIIFLDEPTVGLDPKNRRDVWELIRQLKKKGKTIILTSHYMDEIEALADRILFLHNGSIQAEGTVQEVKHLFGSGVQTLEDAIIQLEQQ